MSVNLSNISGLLKQMYSKDAIVELENLETPFLSLLSDAPEVQVGGAGLYFAVTVKGNASAAFRAEGQSIPAPGNPVPKQATVSAKRLLGQAQVDGLAKASTGNNETAFANAFQYALDRELAAALRFKEGAAFRDGTGQLALFNGPSGNTASTAQGVDTPGAHWLKINDRIDVFNTADVLVATATVTDVDPLGDTIKTDTDISGLIADNYKIYKAGTQTTNGSVATAEMLGMAAHIASSGTYLGISRTTYRNWAGNVVDAGSTPVTEDLLFRALNQIEIVGGMTNPAGFKIVMHPDQRRKYLELTLPQKQFSGLNMDAGYSKLTFNGMPIVTAYSCPSDVVYIGDFSKLKKVYVPGEELHVESEYNGSAIKWLPGYDACIAYFREYGNMVCTKPNSFVKISALTGVTSR